MATVLVLLLPAVLAVIALSHRAPDPPPAQTAVSLPVLPQVPGPLLRAQLDRSRKVAKLTGKLTAPGLLDPITSGAPGALPTLALTPRAKAYSLEELSRLVPAAFATPTGAPFTGGALLLTANLQVPLGATLVIDGRTPDVRLASSPLGFATIISRGTVSIAGDIAHPVRISSWDPVRGETDGNSADGRSFVLEISGRMDADNAVFDHLGFDLGLGSGVAWNGAAENQLQPVKATGDVSSSMFLHNYFGAYTRQADGMHWTGNTFADNDEYGFDPHDFSNDFLVEGNVAYGNGKHGFIFSRSCSHNILRGNTAHDNGGHGFMIDDGRSNSSSTALARLNGSTDNFLTNNSAINNAGNGIEIEGGSQNIVANNQANGNYIGIRVKDDAAVVLTGNTLADNVRYGIDVSNVSGQIPVTGNTISRSWGAINLATGNSASVDSNTTSDVSTPLVVAGLATRDSSWTDSVAELLRWNPMLLLWSLLLGVPIVVSVGRYCWLAAKPKRWIRCP